MHTHEVVRMHYVHLSVSQHCEICTEILSNLRKKNITKSNQKHVFELCCLFMKVAQKVLQYLIYISQNQQEMSAISYVAN
jgi:hypothetical protein